MAVKIEVRRGQGQSQGQGQQWIPWRYYSADCSADFPGVTEVLFPSHVDPVPVVCLRKYYAGDVTTHSREVKLSRELAATLGNIA